MKGDRSVGSMLVRLSGSSRVVCGRRDGVGLRKGAEGGGTVEGMEAEEVSGLEEDEDEMEEGGWKMEERDLTLPPKLSINLQKRYHQG